MADVVQLFAAADLVVAASVLKATVGGTPYTINFATGTYGHYISDATEAGAYLQGLLNAAVAGWTVAMTASGRWKITCSAGTWSILWDGTSSTDRVARDFYGWRDNISATAANTYATADYHPAGCLLGRSSGDETDWQPRFRRAGGWIPGLLPVAWDAGMLWFEKTTKLSAQPRNRAVQSDAGSTLTPVWPVPIAGDPSGVYGAGRLGVRGAFGKDPLDFSATPIDYGGWTVVDHLALPPRTYHAVIDRFQDYVVGATADYYAEQTLDLREPAAITPTTPGSNRRWDVGGLRWHWETDP